MDRISKIRKQYKAKKHSGTRKTSSIRYIVIHDAEVADPKNGAEAVGNYFASPAAKGSTQYGIDNDFTQQYLSDAYVCWGAPPLNTTGTHVELMGKASFSRKHWLKYYGPMLKRGGWWVARQSRKFNVPLDVLTVAELDKRGTHPTKGKGGVVTHATVSKAFGMTTHTDPGDSFPMDVLMAWANMYRSTTRKPVIHRYSVGTWVTKLQKILKKKGYPVSTDGVFGEKTELFVKAFQKTRGLKATGVVGPVTWKALAR